MGKKCPPFCESNCYLAHDSLLVKLLNVQEGNPVSVDEFEEEAEKHFKYGFQPEDPIDDPSPEYRYPILHWAVVLGKHSVIQFLIDKGHNPCIQSREKSETPLHRAVHCLVIGLKNFSDSHRFKRFQQILNLLAPAVCIQDDNGDTPLHLCAKYITEYYLQNYLNYYKEAMESLINVVVQTNQTEVFDMQNKDGNTLVHIFAQTHNELCFLFAKKLIKLGAALNLKNIQGQLSTDVARKYSYKLFMYIDSRKRKLRKRNFRKHSNSRPLGEADETPSSSDPLLVKRLRESAADQPGPSKVLTSSVCTSQLPQTDVPATKPHLVPSLKKDPNVACSTALHTSQTEHSADIKSVKTDEISELQEPKTEQLSVEFPNTPPHMPGDLEQENEDNTELKFELVGDLFSELSNCSAGHANTSALQSKGGVLKHLLKKSGQIQTWVNETRKIVSEKSKELEERHELHCNIEKEQQENVLKKENLERAIAFKKKELTELEKSLELTVTRNSKLERNKYEQKDGIEKCEQLISTLGQIVAILEND